MMKYRIYVPENGQATITSRFSLQELSLQNICVTQSPEDANVIVAALAEELAPFVNQYGSRRRYIIWCDEPLWSCIFQRFDISRVRVSSLPLSEINIPIEVMNCFTGDIFFSNYHFLNESYHLSFKQLSLASKRPRFHGALASSERRIAAFLTYRNETKWKFEHSSGIRSLNILRTRVALEGKIFNKVDIFGQGWPLGLAIKDDRYGSDGRDPFSVKLDDYRSYHFAWCPENTWAPYYVSEKIWHAIISGCLPIYYAGPQHTIYQDFPRNSFIDYFDFKDPIELFEFVDNISESEFNSRIALCFQSLQNSLLISQEGRVALQMQLSRFTDRLESLRQESMLKQIPIQNLFPEPNWRAILGSGPLTILDVGANDGGTSAQFANLFPDSHVYAFEPDQRPIARFRQRWAHLLQSRVTLFEGVVSDVDGEMDFFMSDGQSPDLSWYESGWDLSGSTKKPIGHLTDIPTITFDKVVIVKSIKLDTWASRSNVMSADLAWIDVQGAELNVIHGGGKLLSRTRFLYMEYSDKRLYEGQASVQELLGALPQFEVLQVYSGDVLFRNKMYP